MYIKLKNAKQFYVNDEDIFISGNAVAEVSDTSVAVARGIVANEIQVATALEYTNYVNTADEFNPEVSTVSNPESQAIYVNGNYLHRNSAWYQLDTTNGAATITVGYENRSLFWAQDIANEWGNTAGKIVLLNDDNTIAHEITLQSPNKIYQISYRAKLGGWYITQIGHGQGYLISTPTVLDTDLYPISGDAATKAEIPIGGGITPSPNHPSSNSATWVNSSDSNVYVYKDFSVIGETGWFSEERVTFTKNGFTANNSPLFYETFETIDGVQGKGWATDSMIVPHKMIISQFTAQTGTIKLKSLGASNTILNVNASATTGTHQVIIPPADYVKFDAFEEFVPIYQCATNTQYDLRVTIYYFKKAL